MKERPSITVIGSCIIDIVVCASRLPGEGDSLVASNMISRVGGKASNQAKCIAKLGGDSRLIVSIGNDQWANMAMKEWQKDGVDTTNVFCNAKHPTGMGIVVVNERGENFTLSTLGANRFLRPKEIRSALNAIKTSKVLSMHLNPPHNTVAFALSVAKESGLVTILNASPVEKIPNKIYSLVDVLVVNNTEISKIVGGSVTNHTQCQFAGNELINRGVKAVIVTYGNEGLILITPFRKHHIPAFKVNTVDTTGAGDAFVAGLALGIAEGKDLFSSAQYGCAVSAVAISQENTNASVLSRKKVSRLLNQHKEVRITR